MAVMQLITWWYGSGFGWIISRISSWLAGINKTLAVNVLLKTLFAPWKQITNTIRFSNFIQRLLDNLVSRGIGFVVRLFMLLYGGLWALSVLVFGVLWLIIWPFIPFMIFILPFLAIKGVGL